MGGLGSAWLAALGNCGPCFVKGGKGALRRVISVRHRATALRVAKASLLLRQGRGSSVRVAEPRRLFVCFSFLRAEKVY